MGDLIQFPVRPRQEVKPNCFDCVNGAQLMSGTYCMAFGEHVLSEQSAAADCPTFEEV